MSSFKPTCAILVLFTFSSNEVSVESAQSRLVTAFVARIHKVKTQTKVLTSSVSLNYHTIEGESGVPPFDDNDVL